MESEIIIETPPCIKSDIPLQVSVKPSCPWGQIKPVETVSLNDVMSEQFISSIVEKNPVVPESNSVIIDDLNGCGEEVTDNSDDCVLAQLLQLEFDKEHDELLRREESKYNGDSKVKITYGKYKRLPGFSFSSDEEEDEEKDFKLEQSAKQYWHNFEHSEKTLQSVGRTGVSKQGSVTTTKHDLTLCGRKNAGKMMKFPPCIQTGDGGKFDLKFSNKVFESLRRYSNAENKRGQRLHDKKEQSTVENALDEKTNLILFKLLNNATLESLTGCISTGKEACVYHAWSGTPEDEEKPPFPEYAIKIFKTSLNEFQNRDQYMKDDYRFRYQFSKQNPRKIIHMWAAKEMRNLTRMKEANIPCPEVITLNKHVLVMSFIGKDMLPAPKIKDVDLPFADLTIMFEQTVEIMKTMYKECDLVHADLSEYNLLWHDEKIWVIDVGQAVEVTHPRAMEFLLRDCRNVSNFFEKKGVKEVPSPEKLFFDVCNKQSIIGEEKVE